MPRGIYIRTSEIKLKNSIANKGQKLTPEQYTKLKEAVTGINNGMYGKNHSNKTRQKISKAASISRGGINKNRLKKDNKKIHRWVVKQLGKAIKCEKCYSTEAKRYEWSNKSQLYLVDLSDWWQLCSSCHIKYDISCKTGKSYE